MEALKCNRMLDATGDVESQATRLNKREYFRRKKEAQDEQVSKAKAQSATREA